MVLWTSVLCSNRNRRCCLRCRLEGPVFFSTNSPIFRNASSFHGQFCCTTVGSQIESLTSFARDFSSTAQFSVYTSESSVQRSIQTVFVVTLKLPGSTIQNPFTTGSLVESSISCSFWTKSSVGMCSLQLLCPGSSSPIQTASDHSWHQDQKLQSENELVELSQVCSQPSCQPIRLCRFLRF